MAAMNTSEKLSVTIKLYKHNIGSLSTNYWIRKRSLEYEEEVHETLSLDYL